MGSILLVAEVQKGTIREASYELVSFAKKLGGDLASVVIGSGIAGEAEGFAKRGGGKVYVADDPALANYNVDGWAKAIRAAADAAGAEVILISNTPTGWDVAPRVAAGLDAAFVSDAFGAKPGPVLLDQVFSFFLTSQPWVTGASSVPSFFCGLYSNLILAKFSENWSVGTEPPVASPDW